MDGGPQQTWDVRLAERFLDEIAVGQFWHPYAELVPAPGTMAQPLQLPPSLLEELHHNTMAAAARKQQAALRHQCPGAVPDEDAGNEAYPTPMLWAVGLVRSRALEAGEGFYALVPFLDMANHSDTPNAMWSYSAGDNGRARGFHLHALMPINQGQQVTISYHENMDNRRKFAQYGFVTPGGNPYDRLPGFDKLQANRQYLLSKDRLWETLHLVGMDPSCPDAMPNAALATIRSLPLEEGELPLEEEAKSCRALRRALESLGQSEFKSPADVDIVLYEDIIGGNVAGDEVMLAVLAYRIERKALFGTASELLMAHETRLHEKWLVQQGHKDSKDEVVEAEGGSSQAAA
jgi:hypothetical protein